MLAKSGMVVQATFSLEDDEDDLDDDDALTVSLDFFSDFSDFSDAVPLEEALLEEALPEEGSLAAGVEPPFSLALAAEAAEAAALRLSVR